MFRRCFLFSVFLFVSACGDPNCPAGYTLNAAHTLCVSLDAGLDATSIDVGTDAPLPDLGVDAPATDLGADAASCPSGRADCNSDGTCETDTTNDATNCGACGRACAYGVCTASACDVAVRISAHCAAKGGGSLVCWGANTAGEVGDGTMAQRLVPVVVPGLVGVRDISSLATTCAVRADGTVNCWGSNEFGQLGDGVATHVSCSASSPFPHAYDCSPSPTHVLGVTEALRISVGLGHVCVAEAGAAYCWGDNTSGQLGDGTTTRSSTPVLVTGLTDPAEIAAGNQSTCARRGTDGSSVVCWGTNTHGELGDGTMVAHTSPAAVAGLTNAVSLAAGNGFACAARSDGTVSCWGAPPALGDGSGLTQTRPVNVAGISDAVGVAAGLFHACAVRRTGAVSCWGSNFQGQLGDGTMATSTTPSAVVGLSDAIAVAAAGNTTCALRGAGQVMCWGASPVGDGTLSASSVPVEVSSLH